MKKSLICTLIYLCSVLSIHAQFFPALRFQKFYSRAGTQTPAAIAKSPDGHIIIGGTTQENPPETCTNAWIIKVDTLGEMVWDRELIVSGCETLQDLTVLKDGSVLFTGTTNTLIPLPEKSDPEMGANILVGKISKDGDMDWIQSFGGSGVDQGRAITSITDSTVMLTSSTHSQDGDVPDHFGASDIWMIALSASGNPLSTSVIGGRKHDWPTTITRCKNGDYVVAGFSNSKEIDRTKASIYGNGLVVRINPKGEYVWKRIFGCPNGGYFTDIVEDDAGYFLATGQYFSIDSDQQFWKVYLSPKGETLTNERISLGKNASFSSVSNCADGGYILSGYATQTDKEERYTKGREDFWLFRLSKNRNLVWKQTYGGGENERCVGVIEYSPGVFYALGEKVNYFSSDGKPQGKDFWLVCVEEHPCKDVEAEIVIKDDNYSIERNMKLRFRTRSKYADRFVWDFGDHTTQEGKEILKSYRIPGLYEIHVTAHANESCKVKRKFPHLLEIR